MEQEPNSLISSLLILFIIISFIAHVLVFWPEIVKWYYRNKIRRLRRERLAMLEEKLAALKKPPRAVFFSRVDGKYTTVEGPEEEQYLPRKKGKRGRNKKSLPQVVDKNSEMT